MKATDRTSGKELAPNLSVADTFFKRLKGLLGKKVLPQGEGLWIKPCKSVHTFGMQFPIDVVFLDKEKRIIALFKNLPPNRITRLLPNAKSVIELPVGTLNASESRISNQVVIT